MVEGVRLAQSLAAARAYEPLRGAPVDPDASIRTDADVRAFIRRTADTIFHPAGTCRMGTGADAVVDPQLRVRGIDGLRVADASIIPIDLNSQIHAACVVIGEKASEILASAKCSGPSPESSGSNPRTEHLRPETRLRWS